jgi:hypothetical protein
VNFGCEGESKNLQGKMRRLADLIGQEEESRQHQVARIASLIGRRDISTKREELIGTQRIPRGRQAWSEQAASSLRRTEE